MKRKAVGQIRFFSFLTELSVGLQCCTVIPPDLGLSRRSVLEGSESLLIRPGGQRVYDDITQPLSLRTSLCVSACLPPNPLPLVPLRLPGGDEEVASRAQHHAYLTRPLGVICVHWSDRSPRLAPAVLTERSMTPTFRRPARLLFNSSRSTGASTGQLIPPRQHFKHLLS